MKTDTSVIICAAGNSRRMGKNVNKILLALKDSNVIGYTMRAFENCESVKEIIVVTQEKSFKAIVETAERENITKFKDVVCGGETRQESVKNGLSKISKDTEMIAIHDGARPLVNSKDIERVIQDARVFGGATLGVPVKDTIKVVEDNLIIDTPVRSQLYITQTPQVFKRKIYFEAIEFATLHNLKNMTDDCGLVEAVGRKIYMTMGDYKNIKITTPEDIRTAEAILDD